MKNLSYNHLTELQKQDIIYLVLYNGETNEN